MKFFSIRRLSLISGVAILIAGAAHYFSGRTDRLEGAAHLTPRAHFDPADPRSPFPSRPLAPLTVALRVEKHLKRLSDSSTIDVRLSLDNPGAIPSLEKPRNPNQVPDKTERSIAALERELAALKELQLLKERNELIDLADKVIISGNRSDFAALEKYVASIPAALQEVAKLQVTRVDRHFYAKRGHRSSPLPVSDLFPGKSSEDELTIGELLQILIDGAAPVADRIRAADLLGQTPPGEQPRLPGYLLYAAEHATNLDLIDECLVSFGKLTNVYPNRMFDAVPASVWWDFNNPEKGVTARSGENR